MQQNTPKTAIVEEDEDIGLKNVIDISGMNRTEEEYSRVKSSLAVLADHAIEKNDSEDFQSAVQDPVAFVDSCIAQLDQKLSEQLSQVMHHETFQKVEGSWRGLNYLVKETETGKSLKIKVLDASKEELLKNFRRASEFDQSALFKKIYEAEYGQFGGTPFGALIGDYEFTHRNEDVELLTSLSQVAAASHAPFISASSPEMFGLDNYTDLDKPRDLSMIFESREYAAWNSFRASEDSRYVVLTLPRVLGRLPYDPKINKAEEFNFDEGVNGKDHSKFLWSNAAYSFGSRLTDAYAQYGWCVAIRGVEGGGLVQGLPTFTYTSDNGDIDLKCPTETIISDRREKELSDLGFISLVHCRDTDYAAFFSGQTLQKPKEYDDDTATANANLSTRLPYIMATSRIAHYLKSIVRDKVGGFASRADLQDFLDRWIAQYLSADDTASPAAKAERPLRRAQIDVIDIPGKPGSYQAVAHLQPHYQLEELTMSLRLVAELPQLQK